MTEVVYEDDEPPICSFCGDEQAADYCYIFPVDETSFNEFDLDRAIAAQFFPCETCYDDIENADPADVENPSEIESPFLEESE